VTFANTSDDNDLIIFLILVYHRTMANTNSTATYQQLAQLDYVFKRDAANKVKTDGLINQTGISSANELESVVKVVRADQIWADSSRLLQGPSGSNVPATQQTYAVFSDVHPIIADLRGRSWKAAAGNWVSPDFHPSFTPIFYYGPQAATPVNTIDTSLYPFVFDYGSGILTFLGNVPSYLSSGANIVYASGYTYNGTLGPLAANGVSAGTFGKQ